VWAALHARELYEVGLYRVFFSYPLLPWIGVMFLGFGAAGLFELPEEHGASSCCASALPCRRVHSHSRAECVWRPAPVGARLEHFCRVGHVLLGTTKYPPSLLFVLMTLGPAAIACAYIDRLPGRIKDVLTTFGRAPLAFYIAHLYLIHAVAMLLGMSQGSQHMSS
jgi:uncharacterized membrane protein